MLGVNRFETKRRLYLLVAKDANVDTSLSGAGQGSVESPLFVQSGRANKKL